MTNVDNKSSTNQKLTELIMRAVAAEERPLTIAPAPDWSMDWDNPDAELQHRGQMWDVLAFYSDTTFPLRTPWYGGTTLELREPSEMGRQIFVARNYEPNEFALLDRILAPGMTFVDVGAHQGFYATFAATKVGPSGNVIAFEPSYREARALLKNAAINNLLNVRVFPVAAGRENAVATFNMADAGYSGHNALGEFKLHSHMPTLRFTTDFEVHHWDKLQHGLTQIPIGKGDRVEVMIYSDQPFEFLVRNVEVQPTTQSAGPLVIHRESERQADLPPLYQERFANFDVRAFGDLSISTGDGLYVKGGGGSAGIVFRGKLDPTQSYLLRIEGRGVADAPAERYQVDVVSLDSFLLDNGWEDCDVMKIDVEGIELDVLMGAARLIEKTSPLLLVEVVSDLVRHEGGIAAIAEFLHGHGYILFDVQKGKPRLIDLQGEHSSNIIAAPERFLDKILKLGGLTRADLTAGLSQGEVKTDDAASPPGDNIET